MMIPMPVCAKRPDIKGLAQPFADLLHSGRETRIGPQTLASGSGERDETQSDFRLFVSLFRGSG